MIFIDDFIWLPDIVDKLATKHRVSQDEAEEVFFNRPVSPIPGVERPRHGRERASKA